MTRRARRRSASATSSPRSSGAVAVALIGLVVASLTMSAGATVASMASGPDGPRVDASSATATPADPTQPVENDRENSSTWWIVGGVIAAGALVGIVLGARRRSAAEAWARRASTICDTGRALAATITVHLDEAATWNPPDRAASQRSRAMAAIPALRSSAPSEDLGVLVAEVGERVGRLGHALDSVTDGDPIEAARAAVERPLADLGDALDALEHEVASIVVGASLPSGRTTG